MEKRALIAIILTLLVITIYPYFLRKITPERRAPVGESVSKETMPPHTAETTQHIVTQDVKEAGGNVTRPFVPEKEETVRTDKFEVVFTNIGGAIKEIRLLDYNEYGKEMPLTLAIPDDKKIFSLSGLGGLLDPTAPYEAEYSPGKFSYTYTIPGKAKVVKKYILHNSSYNIELNLSIENLSKKTFSFNYKLLGPSGITIDQKFDRRFVEAVLLPKDANEKMERMREGKLRNSEVTYRKEFRWAGIKNKYFSLIVIPYNTVSYVYFGSARARGDNSISAGVGLEKIFLKSGEKLSHRYELFAVPNKIGLLKAQGQGLEKIVSYGIFGGISKVLIAVLNFFYRVTHNYGVAIILLTILVSGLLYPFTKKSTKSMKEMQRIQPLIEELRVKYKDNPQKMNKELMGLYKEHKVNPLGGCLPMLFQLPVFVALYQGLIRTVELRGAGFLWIDDLSGPDRAFHLPQGVSLPLLGQYINLLPLFMMGIMFIQQKLYASKATTGPQAEQQKMMAVMMPIIFGIIFYNMPSGLVLYWMTNTAIMAGVQFFVLKR